VSAAPDPWAALRAHTAARIALGRAGVSLPTAEWLRFAQAHALARDAVQAPFDSAALSKQLVLQGFDCTLVESAAPDRATYLRRPDLGRRLSPRCAALLANGPPAAGTETGGAHRGGVAVVVADGLSAQAVQRHALPLLLDLRARLEAPATAAAMKLGPVLLAHQARVALGDEIGGLLQSRAVLVLIGERPGLSSPDSLGAYLTWAPQPGRSDAERNCVSNIRPEGLPCAAAAHKIAWLLGAAQRLGGTGVALKDESDRAALPAALSPLRVTR
jgi:ethanolamine ammonia-lyase small subunit